jgi:hypothetical protein
MTKKKEEAVKMTEKEKVIGVTGKGIAPSPFHLFSSSPFYPFAPLQ